MSHYKPYPAYKDSGVEWLGDVPEHWEKFKLKYIFREKRNISNPDLPAGAISFGRVVEKDSESLAFDTRATYQEVLPGEFLVNPINLNYDLKSLRTALSRLAVCVSPAYIVLAAVHEQCREYLEYLLYRFDVAHMKTLGAGVRQTITFADIGSCECVLPPIKEQIKIAAYLECETTRIDALISKKTRFIELLREKRQALITHAVTKGLDPSVKMKDSGVEWLGEVPEHWDVCKLSFRYSVELGKMLDEKRISGSSLMPYLRNQDVQWNSVNTQDLPKMDIYSEELARYTVRAGDLLVCEGGDVGRAAIWRGSDDTTGFQKALHRLRPRSAKYDAAEFFFFSLMTAKARGVFDESDAKATIAHLPAEKFRQYRFAFPPQQEQYKIAAFVREQAARLDDVLEMTSRSIELLKERRSALITAAVTGQIDLREAA